MFEDCLLFFGLVEHFPHGLCLHFFYFMRVIFSALDQSILHHFWMLIVQDRVYVGFARLEHVLAPEICDITAPLFMLFKLDLLLFLNHDHT